MKILVACEESQRVTIELRKLGHEAYSCDIIPCSGGHPEWHLQQDVTPLLKQHWDMIIAFPPCTHLAVSGAQWFPKKRVDGRQREGIKFFCQFLEADCPKVVIENPVGIISGDYIKTHFPDLAEKYNLPRKPDQIIQPWMFGDNYAKGTCLWLKGVKPLVPEVTEEPELDWFDFVTKKGEKKRQPRWYYEALSLPSVERAKVRSRTFPGIARAMAEQWAGANV